MNNPADKWMRVITGPNGSGKSTFAAQMSDEMKALPYFNPDREAAAIQRQSESKGNPLSPEIAYQQAFEVQMQRVKEYQSSGQSFILETTAPGINYKRLAQTLRNEGWKIGIIALGIATPELSAARIADRVSSGGHDAPVSNTLWHWCMMQTPAFLSMADNASLYDNSGGGLWEIATRNHRHEKFILKVAPDTIPSENTYMMAMLSRMVSLGLLAPVQA